ncbi:MAG: hypothetical protein QOJ80_1412 [Mycobacterium sp.]|jgi:hypothetical protein|nr:hypothetical protein [Mycobacterium sp.]
MSDTQIGVHRRGDPRGWLLFDSMPPDLQTAEDARLAADREHIRENHGAPAFLRTATATERTLLEHLGYDLPDLLLTRVHWLSSGVRNRRWPALETEGVPAA